MIKLGRPSKYDPSILKQIEEYFTEAIPQNMRIPTIEGICLKVGIHKDTIYAWAKIHPDISDALELCKSKQKEYLTEIGIFGGKEINSNIVSLFLKANHDMVEKTATDITSGGEKIGVVVTEGHGNKNS